MLKRASLYQQQATGFFWPSVIKSTCDSHYFREAAAAASKITNLIKMNFLFVVCLENKLY